MSQEGPLKVLGSGVNNPVETLTGNSGGPVGPDASFNVNVVGNTGSGINIVGNPGTHTLTVVNTLTITGDTGGPISPAFSNWNLVAHPVSGSSVNIKGSGSTLQLNVTDANLNTIVGLGAGNNAITATGSIGFGYQALQSISQNINNLGIGYQALNNCSGNAFQANGNTAVGYQSGSNITTGGLNIAIGYQAMGPVFGVVATTGGGNICIGLDTGPSITSGSNNIGMGFANLSLLTTGNFNVSVGYQGIQGLTTGSSNTGIGNGTLIGVVTGSNNTAIGINAGSNYASSESNNISINNLGVISESGVIRIGTSGTQTSCYIAGIEGVAVSNTNMVTINTATGQLGSQAVPSGGITTINGDSGSVTGATVTFNAQSQAGYTVKFTGSGSTMSFNVADANRNINIGQLAGNASLVGSFNTSVGNGTCEALTSGINNVAMGYTAFQTATNDSANVAIGTAAMNVANGSSNNTAVGNAALLNFVSGTNNIAIGYAAGDNYTAAESNNILVGNLGTAAESAVIRIGTSGTQTSCYIAGIEGVTVANPQAVYINTSTGQLGSSPSGSFSNYTAVAHAASPYTTLSTDVYIGVTVTGGVVTIKLPNAPSTGRIYIIKDTVGDSSVNNITVTTIGGAVTIDGATSYVMSTNYQAINVIFNGTSYEVY